MKFKNSLMLVLFVSAMIVFSSCTPKDTVQVNENSGKEPYTDSTPLYEIVLDITDLPEDYVMEFDYARGADQIPESAIKLGWKEGRYLKFTSTDPETGLTTYVEQYISRYTKEVVNQVFELPYDYKEGTTFQVLEDPYVGDRSEAYDVKVPKGDGTYEQQYRIQFIQKDIYVNLFIKGASANYTLLEELAYLAQDKFI